VQRILRYLCVSAPRIALGALIFLGIAVNFANVVGRYAFDAPIIWAEEILVFIMIWCVFLGAIVVTWEGQHIRMDLITARLRPPWRSIINVVGTLAMILVCLFVIGHSWIFVRLLFTTGQQSAVARLPAWMMHAAILAGFSGMLLVVLVRWRSYLTGVFGDESGVPAPGAAATAAGDSDQKTAQNPAGKRG